MNTDIELQPNVQQEESLLYNDVCEIIDGARSRVATCFFYETECIKGTWSVKELRRQLSTNLYFRSGVSKNPKKLLTSIEPERNTAALTIRQPFAFEFLRLNAKDVVSEGDLEDALISHLQDFLLELGKGRTLSSSLRMA